MSLKSKNCGDFVRFFPDEARGLVNGFDEVGNPLVERTILDGEKGEASAKHKRENNEWPFEDKNEITGKEKVGEEHPERKLKKLFERHIAHKAELILGDILGDGVLLHTFKYTSAPVFRFCSNWRIGCLGVGVLENCPS